MVVRDETNIMKRILILAFAVALSATSIAQTTAGTGKTRQGKGNPQRGATLSADQRAAKITARLAEKLLLSDDQKANVLQYALKRETQRDLDQKNFAGQPDKLKEAAKARNKAFKDSLEAILTPEQKVKLEAMRKEQKQKAQLRNQAQQGIEDGEL